MDIQEKIARQSLRWQNSTLYGREIRFRVSSRLHVALCVSEATSTATLGGSTSKSNSRAVDCSNAIACSNLFARNRPIGNNGEHCVRKGGVET
jgi:hypothetical protein